MEKYMELASVLEKDETEVSLFFFPLNKNYFNPFNSQPLDLIFTHVKHL
jgi:hypothetical protein